MGAPATGQRNHLGMDCPVVPLGTGRGALAVLEAGSWTLLLVPTTPIIARMITPTARTPATAERTAAVVIDDCFDFGRMAEEPLAIPALTLSSRRRSMKFDIARNKTPACRKKTLRAAPQICVYRSWTRS